MARRRRSGGRRADRAGIFASRASFSFGSFGSRSPARNATQQAAAATIRSASAIHATSGTWLPDGALVAAGRPTG